MSYPADILNSVITMAMHGRSIREVAEFIDPDNITELVRELSDKYSELYDAYKTGNASMDADVRLTVAQTDIEINNLNRMRKVDELIADYLGENINDDL